MNDTIRMPNSFEIEKSVISSFIHFREMFNAYKFDITPDHFYNSELSKIYKYMLDKNCNDFLILCERFSDSAILLSECLEIAISKSNICGQIDLLNDKFLRRKFIESSYYLINESINNNDDDIVKISNKHTKKINKLLNNIKSNNVYHIRDVLPEVMNQIEASARGIKLGLTTGLIDIDNYLGGMQKGDLIIIAARPAMGKSSLATNIVRFNSIINKKVCLIFTLEMDKNLTSSRILFSELEMNYSTALNGMLTKKDFGFIGENISKVAESEIYIDDTPSISTDKIRSRSIKVKEKYGLDMIIVDHMQLMSGDGGKSRNEEMAGISKELKGIARECEVPLIGLSQLSREVERRKDQTPMLSDLRDSGAIEADADKVLMLYRDEYYNIDSKRKGISDVIIAKNKNGKTGIVECVFDKETMSFKSISKNKQTKSFDW